MNETTTTATAAAAKHCYLGDGHSSGRVRDLPRDAGHGAVEGRVVLGLATPADVDDRAYFYVYGDVRKYYGRFPGDLLAVGSVAERPTLAFQGEPNDSNNVDLEACGPLKNAEDVRGCRHDQCTAELHADAVWTCSAGSEPRADGCAGSCALCPGGSLPQARTEERERKTPIGIKRAR